MSFFTGVYPNAVSGASTVVGNYFDLTYSAGLLSSAQSWLQSYTTSGPSNTTSTISGNVNLHTTNPMTLNETAPYR